MLQWGGKSYRRFIISTYLVTSKTNKKINNPDTKELKTYLQVLKHQSFTPDAVKEKLDFETRSKKKIHVDGSKYRWKNGPNQGDTF